MQSVGYCLDNQGDSHLQCLIDLQVLRRIVNMIVVRMVMMMMMMMMMMMTVM